MSGNIFFQQLRRSRGRTWLNILLLAAAVAFFVMSANLYKNSVRNLETAEDAFTTIALMELQGNIDQYGNLVAPGDDSFVGEKSVTVYGYDLSAIIGAEGVVDYDLRSHYGAYIPEQPALEKINYLMNPVDIIRFQLLENEPVKLAISNGGVSLQNYHFQAEVLYSAAGCYDYGTEVTAHAITLYDDASIHYENEIKNLNGNDSTESIVLYPETEYLAVTALSDGWMRKAGERYFSTKDNSWDLNLVFDDWGKADYFIRYGNQGEQTRNIGGSDCNQPFFLWKWDSVQSDPDLMTYWEAATTAVKYNVSAYSVILTDDISGIPAFHLGGAYLKEGRQITAEEYSSGDKVCLVSAQQANLQNWKIGDTIDLYLYEYDAFPNKSSKNMNWGENQPIYYQDTKGFFHQGEYEIVGIYASRDLVGSSEISASTVALPWNNIYITQKSVNNMPNEYNLPVHGNLLTIWLENGSIDRFLEQMDALGLTEYREDRYNPSFAFYDQGYSIIQPSLQAMNSTSKLLLILSSVFLLVVSALLAHFFAQNQKQSVGILRMLGGSKKQAMIGVLACGLLLVTVGTLCGAMLGHCLCGAAGEGILNSQMEEQAITQPFRAFVLTEETSVAEQLSVHGIPSLTAAAGLAGAVLFPLLLLCNLLMYIHKEPRELLPKAKQ